MKDSPTGSPNDPRPDALPEARREFLKQSSLLTALALTPTTLVEAADTAPVRQTPPAEPVRVSLTINGQPRNVTIEPRVTLLDLLRERLDLTGTKKGCDYGQCGACTVHVNGQRVLACLTLAVMLDGQQVTTIEGLTGQDGAQPDQLHPMQAAFIEHDGFQCGYCTPGQIMSAVACIREGHAGSEAEIREYMSGNICRCGAYANIVTAITAVEKGGQRV